MRWKAKLLIFFCLGKMKNYKNIKIPKMSLFQAVDKTKTHKWLSSPSDFSSFFLPFNGCFGVVL